MSSTGSVSHFEPQVAILCDVSNRGQEAYQPKYMTEQGEWASDLRSKASCLKDKMDILNYCKMVSLLTLMSLKASASEHFKTSYLFKRSQLTR